MQSQTAAQEAAQGENANTQSPLASATQPQGSEELTEEERKEVEELKRRDREVRAHEQAHKSAGGSIAGNPSFETVTGPDGRSYAVSGEVKIDTSPVPNNPDATIRKMEVVKRAALAPSQP
ncbi:MAG: putative metalloprotease CJM1_0395 family protein, partial [Methyloligellaceae bacterium]